MMSADFGFQEITHTADLSIKVWAPTMEGLFVQAAAAMYHSMKLDIMEEKSGHTVHTFHVEGIDYESLLVLFLSELLFFIEEFDFGSIHLYLNLKDTGLDVVMEGGRIIGHYQEIKAVTYHDLHIQETKNGFITNIVFDI